MRICLGHPSDNQVSANKVLSKKFKRNELENWWLPVETLEHLSNLLNFLHASYNKKQILYHNHVHTNV